MEHQKVLVTGLGSVAAFGLGADVLWNKLKHGYSALGPVARTIADLEASAAIQKNHLLEALSYRRLDVLSQESQQI